MKKSPVSLSCVLSAAISIGAMVSCSSSISGDRPVAADGRALHRPEQLDDFILEKPVNIRGQGTKAALETLDRAYRETCSKAGEVPLNLSYEVPAGYDRPLSLTLGGRFDGAVREIAATSKLELTRRGNTYRFQVPQGDDQLVQQSYSVPPDFLSRVSRDAYEQRLPIRVAFEKRGVAFSTATRLSLRGSQLGVETRDRGDAAAISGTVQAFSQDSPLQIHLDSRAFEIPAGQSWDGPANGIAGDGDVAKLRRISGVQEQALPAPTTRSFEPGRVLLPEGALRFQAGLLGLGVQVKADLSQKIRGRRPILISMEGQAPDGGTRIATATRPDGSRVVLALTPTIIDATGRPVNQTP
jgi:hypothetical protein